MMENLNLILKKDPIIHTFLATELISNPSRVKQVYSLHADTHMSLAESSSYYDRAIKSLTKNKSTFVGGVTGDYGLGKTSLLVHFWRKMQKDNVLSIPPYCWERFDDNFRAVRAWIIYQLQESHPNLISKVNQIYHKYTEPSLNNEAQKMVKTVNANYQNSLNYLTTLFDSGKLNLNLSTEDFLNYMQEITTLLVDEQKIFNGVIVFFDELQRSIEKNTLNMVAGILFDLSSSLIERDGNYGIMMGMPIQTQAALAVERSDIFDRLEKYKCYILLEDLYGPNFALELWNNYAKKFSFNSQSVVEPSVLESLGQITNSKRKDLGNGPRSVISAFNRIVEWYQINCVPYNLDQLFKDLLSKEITLGERSIFVTKINELISKPFCMENNAITIALSVLACFPDGCPFQVLKAKQVEEGLELLLQHAYGDLIRELPNKGYVLVSLQDKASTRSQSAIENRLIQFRNRYAPDKNHSEMAMHAFLKFIVPKLFEGWIIPSYDNSYSCTVISDENTLIQPYRKVKISLSNIDSSLETPLNDAHFQLNFILNYISEKNSLSQFLIEDKNSAKFILDLTKSKKIIEIPVINNDIIPTKLLSPLFALSFLGFIKNKEQVIPQAEKEQLNHIIDYLSDDIASVLINSQTISFASNGIYQLNNAGRYLIQELVNDMARKCFPSYFPLQVSAQWENRLNSYLSLLQNENISLKQKMSMDYLIIEKDKKLARKTLADLLNLSPTTVDGYLQYFSILFDLSEYELGRVKLKLHPIESLILDMLKQVTSKTIINGRNANYVLISELTAELLNIGYLQTEIEFIINKLGFSRKLFEVIQIGNSPVIIQKFVSLEDVNKQLSDVLKEARSIYDSFNNIDSFDPPIDLNNVEERLMQLKSEVEADQISRELASFKKYSQKAFLRLINLRKRDIERYKEVSQGVKNYITSHKGVLHRKIESNVTWVPVLFKIQNENLLSDLSSIHDYIKILDSDICNLQNIISSTEQEFLYTKLQQIEEESSSIELKIDQANKAFSALSKNLNLLIRWHKLAEEALDIFKLGLRAKDLGCIEQYQRIESVEEEIDMYLKQHRKGGLPNVEIFENKYIAVRDEINNYLISARTKFLDIKDNLVRKITPLRNPEFLHKALFSEADPQASYQGLSDSLQRELRHILDSLSGDVLKLYEDINYMYNVSKDHLTFDWSATEVLSNSLNTLEHIKENIIRIEINSDYISDNCPISEFLSRFKSVQENYQSVLKSYRKTKSAKPNLNEMEAEILNKISIEGTSLQGLFVALRLIDKNLTTEKLFNVLKDLFEKTQITLSIKREKK